MSITIIEGPRATQEEFDKLNSILARIGGYFDFAHRIPWFKLAWAATDFLKDKDLETGFVREYKRCFHEKQNSYHILRYHPDASVMGGDYLCVMHLLDTSPCPTHRFDAAAVVKQGEECLCAPMRPAIAIAEQVAPILHRNRTRDDAARLMAEEEVRMRRAADKSYQQFMDELFDPFEPSYNGRMPDYKSPQIRRLLDQNGKEIRRDF